MIDTTQEPSLLPDDQDNADPALALLTAAAVSGAIPAGPEFRQRAPVRLATHPPAPNTGPLCTSDSGFTLHAATIARRDDPRGQEALLRYLLRPPLAQSRLQTLDNGLCRITLKRAFSDGTFAIDLDPLSLLSRLAASVPAPGFNTVRYAGVLAAAATWRPLVIPQAPARNDAGQHTGTQHPVFDQREHEVTHNPRRSRWRPWDELLKRSFDIERLCPRCHSPMKLKSFLTSDKSLQRLLSRLGEPTDVQGKALASGPPYFASQVLRQRFAEQGPQLDFLERSASPSQVVGVGPLTAAHSCGSGSTPASAARCSRGDAYSPAHAPPASGTALTPCTLVLRRNWRIRASAALAPLTRSCSPSRSCDLRVRRTYAHRLKPEPRTIEIAIVNRSTTPVCTMAIFFWRTTHTCMMAIAFETGLVRSRWPSPLGAPPSRRDAHQRAGSRRHHPAVAATGEPTPAPLAALSSLGQFCDFVRPTTLSLEGAR